MREPAACDWPRQTVPNSRPTREMRLLLRSEPDAVGAADGRLQPMTHGPSMASGPGPRLPLGSSGWHFRLQQRGEPNQMTRPQRSTASSAPGVWRSTRALQQAGRPAEPNGATQRVGGQTSLFASKLSNRARSYAIVSCTDVPLRSPRPGVGAPTASYFILTPGLASTLAHATML